MTKSMIRAALWYGRHGWYIIPLHEVLFAEGEADGCTCEAWRREHISPDFVCKSPGKHPRMNSWEEKASNDTDQITRWWKAWPNANIGVACGKSGLLVIDNDSYKGDGLQASYETVTSITGGGGEHLFFRHPDIEAKLGNSSTGLPGSVDVRGWGGFVVLAPSLHKSGDRYQWEEGYGVHEHALAQLPDEVLEPLVAASKTRIANKADLVAGDKVCLDSYASKLPGLLLALLSDDRSKIDFWIIRGLLRAGLPDNEIYTLYLHSDPTGKFSEKNGHGKGYLEITIANAKAHIEKFKRKIYETYDEG